MHMKGAVVEWLEHLAVVRKVAGSRPARAKTGKLSLSAKQQLGT